METETIIYIVVVVIVITIIGYVLYYKYSEKKDSDEGYMNYDPVSVQPGEYPENPKPFNISNAPVDYNTNLMNSRSKNMGGYSSIVIPTKDDVGISQHMRIYNNGIRALMPDIKKNNEALIFGKSTIVQSDYDTAYDDLYNVGTKSFI